MPQSYRILRPTKQLMILRYMVDALGIIGTLDVFAIILWVFPGSIIVGLVYLPQGYSLGSIAWWWLVVVSAMACVGFVSGAAYNFLIRFAISQGMIR